MKELNTNGDGVSLDTVESLYLEPPYLEISLCRIKYLVPRMRFQANILSLFRTLV